MLESRHRVLLALGIVGAVAVLLLARYLQAGQVWGVRWDILYITDIGGGRISAGLVLWSWMAAVFLTGMCIYAFVRKTGGVRWLWALLVVVAIVPTGGTRREPSLEDHQRVIEQGRKIVTALEAFKQAEGHYPDQLEALVPQYLTRIPKNGLASKRQFEYYTKPRLEKTMKHSPRLAEYDEYVLLVPFVPGGTLIYRPSERYNGVPGLSAREGWFHTAWD